MKLTAAILILFQTLNGNSQVILKGYKCVFPKGQLPECAQMYNGNDTFALTTYLRDINGELNDTNDTPKNRLRAGLHYCFYNTHYFKTKDSLYIATGKYSDNIFYYKVYIPDKEVSLSLTSNTNDSGFSDKSKWLLSQIRRNKRGEMYLLNEKHQTCQNPY